MKSAAYELDNTNSPPSTGNGWYLKEVDGTRIFDYRVDEAVNFVCADQHPRELVLEIGKHLACKAGVELSQVYYTSPISKTRIELIIKSTPHRYNGL
jgi:hypothetical protein